MHFQTVTTQIRYIAQGKISDMQEELKERMQIVDYRDELKEHIKKINYAWLEEFFTVEENDALMLSNPQKYIIEPGGYIFYGEVDGEIVGCAALMRVEDGVYELGKMGVYKEFRGHRLGTVLLEHCIATAKRMHMKTLILYSSRKLKNAIHLYEKYGFVEVKYEGGTYARGDIKMELKLM